ncbi:MAG: deaminase [Actinomycetota bacterium]
MRAVVGLTGAFGSGCTSAAKHLRDSKGYRYASLSGALRDEWTARHGDVEPSRQDLQQLGDDLRAERTRSALVDLALGKIADDPNLVVVDSIRNLGEVRALREAFGDRFSLIGVLARQEDRWMRIGSTQYADHGLTQADFLDDDARDKEEEETPNGQQVALCVDAADMLVNSSARDIGSFYEKVSEFADLAAGGKRYAETHEIFMHMAYSSSHSSKCLKRHVGAVLVNDRGDVVGVGYNENPVGTLPCVEEPEYDFRCFRDNVRNDTFQSLVEEAARCPACGEPLQVEEGPPWRCSNCVAKGVKSNLEVYFFPDRAMNWCTAIHAEVRALMAAGPAARNTVLYTTTFPCFQCAEKITQAGVKEIWFTEAYPDTLAAQRLQIANIDYSQFEGVRSAAFERIFSTMNPK